MLFEARTPALRPGRCYYAEGAQKGQGVVSRLGKTVALGRSGQILVDPGQAPNYSRAAWCSPTARRPLARPSTTSAVRRAPWAAPSGMWSRCRARPRRRSATDTCNCPTAPAWDSFQRRIPADKAGRRRAVLGVRDSTNLCRDVLAVRRSPDPGWARPHRSRYPSCRPER